MFVCSLVLSVVLGGFASPQGDRPTDCRDAADLYKTWATKQSWCVKTFAQRDDLPAWLVLQVDEKRGA